MLEQRLLRRVEVLDEVDDAARVVVDDLLLVAGPLVEEADLEALVEERHHLEPLEQGAGDELGALSKTVGSGQNVTVVPVRPRGALPTDLELALRLAAVGELHAMAVAVAVDLDIETLATAR